MKSLQLGLMVAITLAVLLGAVLFGSVLWVAAQSTPPDQNEPVEASAVQAAGLRITATVGTIASECATTSTAVVRANTTVYYCFTVHNTGTPGADEALTLHNVRSTRGLAQDRNLDPFIVNPGEIKNTIASGFVFTDISAVDATNFITWTGRPADNEPQVIASTNARIDIVNPALNVVKSVGLSQTDCGSDRTLRVPTNQTVYFCITLENTGDITLTNHTLNDQPLSIINATFVYTLPPRQDISIIPSNLTTIIPGTISTALNRSITSQFVNNVTVTSLTRNNLSTTGVSTATVDIGSTTVRFTKTLSTQPEECGTSSTLQIPQGTRLYYCATIVNTGAVTLTEHHLTEPFLSIDVLFNYPLAPGATLRVTNDFLARANQPVVFGPFEIHPRFGNVVNNAMTYEGRSDEGFGVKVTFPTSTTYPPTPTITPTSRPDATNTPIPGPTNTPTITPIPQSPTPTETPTFTPETPTATPTRSYAISLLETPTPRAQIAGIPQDPQQDPQQQPVDPNQPQQSQDLPLLPGQDPSIATATQIAVDATVTAVAAVATASQLAIEGAAATALAEAQGPLPDSPLPTPTFEFPLEPTLDPSIAQSGNSDDLPVAPGVEIPTETPLPGAEVTILPPLVTAVIATEMPAVVMLVVTNTPAPGEVERGAATALAEAQRPIVPPTPTATPDFVMAAARTFDVAVTTMGWLWFLVGSLVFFVTAGIVAGLFFRQSETSRFDLPEPDYWLEEEPPPVGAQPPSTRQSAEDEWPAELP